ncbi:MAG: hypothetical protein Q7S40_08220 [Opitutaceae bacterium]|nr:hypothetical protein [Opitutaceae bacterium]
MQTPSSNDVFGAHEPSVHDRPLGDAHTSAPAVIVAGSRMTRELVRLLVATAFCVLEAVFSVAELRINKPLHRKRRA